jgi:hypothetical protein
MARPSRPVLSVAFAWLATVVAAADPPAAPAPGARPALAPAHAALAGRLRAGEAAVRVAALADLERLDAQALRAVLAAAGTDAREPRRWARTLLGLARAATEPRRRELVRALLVQREVLRRAENPAARAEVPLPVLPRVPAADPAGRAAVATEIELRLVQARGPARALLLEPGASPAAAGAAAVSEATLSRALAAGEADGSARVLGSPTLALVGAGSSALALTRRRSYVERYDVTGDAGRTIVSPVVDVLEEGVRIVVSPSAAPAAGPPTLHVRVDLVEAVEPIDAFDAPLALPGEERELTVRVVVPDVRTATLERVLVLPPGPWTLLGAVEPPAAPQAGTVVLLARTRAPRRTSPEAR